MNTLKAYQVQKMEVQVNAITKEFRKLRERIEMGDMKAIEQLSELQVKAQSLQNVIKDFLALAINNEIYVYLVGYSTTLSSLFMCYQPTIRINESRVRLPWKKQASSLKKAQSLNGRSKKSSISQNLESSCRKSHNQSKSKLSKNSSERQLTSREQTQQHSGMKQSQRSFKQVASKTPKNEKPLSLQKQNKQGYRNVKSRNYDKSSKSKWKETQGLITIRISEEEFEEIIKLKASLAR